MKSEVQEVNALGERRELPFERTEALLLLLKSFPSLTIYRWVGIVYPDAKLVVDISLEVEEIAAEVALK